MKNESLIKVKMVQDLVHYPDRVNRAFYPKGSLQEFPKEKVDKFLMAGYCETLEKTKSFETRETKPAILSKETKPTPKAKAKTKAKSKTTAKKTASKRVRVEKQSNDSTND